jgi:hypothetical protein
MCEKSHYLEMVCPQQQVDDLRKPLFGVRYGDKHAIKRVR